MMQFLKRVLFVVGFPIVFLVNIVLSCPLTIIPIFIVLACVICAVAGIIGGLLWLFTGSAVAWWKYVDRLDKTKRDALVTYTFLRHEPGKDPSKISAWLLTEKYMSWFAFEPKVVEIDNSQEIDLR